MTDFDLKEQRLRRTLQAVAERSPVGSGDETSWPRRAVPATHRPGRLLLGAVAALVLIGAVAVAVAYGPRSSDVGRSAQGSSLANGSFPPWITWSSARVVATDFGVTFVGCTSPSFCLGLGASGKTGVAGTTLWNGSTWSTPRVLGGPPTGVVGSLSCASPTFCEALSTTENGYDGAATAYRWNGVRWSSGTLLGGASSSKNPTDVTGVSCPSSSFCMAVDGAGDDFTFDGRQWSEPAHFDTTPASPDEAGGPSAVSCATATSCMVVDSGGYALSWNGNSWSVPVDVTPSGPDLVSCPTRSWCLAMNANSYASIWNGQRWKGPQFVDPEAMHVSQSAGSMTPVSWGQGDFGLLSVSCATRTFCVAIDDAGYAISFDGTSWSSPASIGPGLDNRDVVSCTAPRFCVVTSNEGQVIVGRG